MKCQITPLLSISAAAPVAAPGSSNPTYVTRSERRDNSSNSSGGSSGGIFSQWAAQQAAPAPSTAPPTAQPPASQPKNGDLQASAAAVLESMFSNESSQLYRDYVNLPPPPPYPGSAEEQKQRQQQQQGWDSLLLVKRSCSLS